MARPADPEDVTGILRLGGTILGTVNRGNPFAAAHRDARGHVRLRRSRARDVPEDGARRARLHRRRRHAGHLLRVLQARHPAGLRAEDDRQRHRRHDELLRLRHRRQLRHRRDRPPAHDGRSAPTGDGGGGDGPLRRLDCAARRRGRRRRRDPDSRDSLRPARRWPRRILRARPRGRAVQHRGRGRGCHRAATAAGRSSRPRTQGTPSGSAVRARCARTRSRR